MKYLLLCLMSVLMFIPEVASADVLIITNNNVAEDTMTEDQIKDIFLGKKIKWADNKKVHFAILKNETIHKQFLEAYIDKSKSQYKRYWKQMVFSGRGSMPVSFDTPEELVQYVAKTEGAVGYIDEGTTVVNVKTINLTK